MPEYPQISYNVVFVHELDFVGNIIQLLGFQNHPTFF